MSTCNRLDLQTLGCQLIMPKNLPNHWFTRTPSLKSRVARGQSIQYEPLRAWKVGHTTSHRSQVMGHEYDMDAYLATLLGGKAWDLC